MLGRGRYRGNCKGGALTLSHTAPSHTAPAGLQCSKTLKGAGKKIPDGFASSREGHWHSVWGD